MAVRRREDILKRSREMKSRRRTHRRLALVITFVVFISASLIALNLNAFDIKSILVRGTGSLPSGDIELLAREGMLGSYLYLVPRTNIFFYPHTALLKNIRELSPRIASVRMHVTTTRILVIDITEHAPRYLWCGKEEKSCSQ